MHKLCTLKDICPGSVVQIPKEYASYEGELAVVFGLEYDASKQNIRTQLWRDRPTCELVSVPAKSDLSELMVVEDDDKLQTRMMNQFVAHQLKLPTLELSSGCDPEIFVVHQDDSVFPAWEFMPDEEAARVTAKQWLMQSWRNPANELNHTPGILSTQWDNPESVYCPLRVPAYWDGAQAEFAPWAKGCLETLHYGTREGLRAVFDAARAKDPQAKLTLQNVVELPATVLKDADDKHIQFRCSQSYNIYNDPGDGISNAREYKYRCAGGHIHLGFTRAFTAPGIEQIVRGLDGVLGVIGVSLAAGIDNPERRRTYGRCGEFRLPRHGIEYRVLSNFWLSHPAIAMLVFELARATVKLAESGLYHMCWLADENEIREVINSCDVAGARQILQRNVGVLKGMIDGLWGPLREKRPPVVLQTMQELALKTIMNGMDAAIKDPLDIAGNWKLQTPDAWKNHCRGNDDSWTSLAAGLTKGFDRG